MDDKYCRNVELVQEAVRQKCASLEPNPYLAQRVLNEANGKGGRKMKKIYVGFALVTAMMLMSVTALAAVLLTGHDVKLYEGVAAVNLLPDQWQSYDVCHRLEDGYLVGGFSLEENAIAPMDGDDAIVMLDQSFRVRWTLTDARLEGCLFDKVHETADALYMGMERSGEAWVPAIMKLDKSGSIAWLYEGQPEFGIKDFCVDAEGNAYGVGRVRNGDGQQAAILKLDADGQVAWEKTYADIPAASLTAAKLYHQRILLAGYAGEAAWIGELKPDGEFAWQKLIEQDAPVQTARLQTNADGRMVLSVEFAEAPGEEGAARLRYYVLDAGTLTEE